MFATTNDTSKWVLAIDGLFGFCKSEIEANRLYGSIGEIGEIGESNFGCCQIIPPHYIPKINVDLAKQLGESEDMTLTRVSDHKAIDITAYINTCR